MAACCSGTRLLQPRNRSRDLGHFLTEPPQFREVWPVDLDGHFRRNPAQHVPHPIGQGPTQGAESPRNTRHGFPNIGQHPRTILFSLFAKLDVELHRGDRHHMVTPLRTPDAITHCLHTRQAEEPILGCPRNLRGGLQGSARRGRHRHHGGWLAKRREKMSSHMGEGIDAPQEKKSR